MTQKRLASTLLTQGSTAATYTVPAGKSAVVSIFARNIGDDSAVVDLSHSQNTPPADNTVAEQVNTAVYTDNKQAPLGILNLGTTTVKLAVPTNISAGGDPSPNTAWGPVAIWDEFNNVAVQPYNSGVNTSTWTMSSSSLWQSRGYQISAFYEENDYYVFNNNRYPRRVKGYPWDAIDKNYQAYDTNAVFGGHETAPTYFDYGSAGFRTQIFTVNSQGYVTRTHSINAGTATTGTIAQFTSVINSTYGLQQNGYPTNVPYSLSILPTAKGSSKNLRLVSGSSSGSGSFAIWSTKITDGTSTQTYSIDAQVQTRTNWTTAYTAAMLTLLWYRPVGEYVYAASSTKVFRAPIGKWHTDIQSWVDVTSSFPTNLNFNFAFIEDKNFYGYTVTTNGDVVSTKDGVTWIKGDASVITSGIGSVSNAYTGVKLSSYDQFPVYTSTGRYNTLIGLDTPTMKPDLFEASLTVPSKSHLEHRGIILNAGDKVYARSTNTNTIIDVYGFEE